MTVDPRDEGIGKGPAFLGRKSQIVVGGGNSAGHAAVFLAGRCRPVHLLVRAKGLAETMSQYLIRRINESSNITLRTNTEITSVQGGEQLERASAGCRVALH